MTEPVDRIRGVWGPEREGAHRGEGGPRRSRRHPVDAEDDSVDISPEARERASENKAGPER